MSGGKHTDNFMALRFVAAVLVIFGHAYPLTGTVSPGFLGNSIQTLAVKIFFVISGYLIAQSWLNDPNIGRYLARRGARIFPGLWALTLLTVFIVGPVLTSLTIAEYFWNDQAYRYLDNLLLKPNYALPGVFEHTIYQGAVNGSLWTLPVEFSMYLTLPVLLLLPGARYLVPAAFASTAIGSLYFARIAIPETPIVFWGTSAVNALEMAPYFLIGSTFRLWATRRFFNLQVSVAMLFLMPLFATDWTRSEIVTLFVLPYCVLAFGFSEKPLFAEVARLGDVSYGIYLYGFLVQQIVSERIGTDGDPIQNFLISTAITIPLGLLSWNLVEKPSLDFMRRQISQRRQARESATNQGRMQSGKVLRTSTSPIEVRERPE